MNDEKVIPYQQLHRIDILCGLMDYPTFPCDKCKKIECRGKGECKGFGAWSYGLRVNNANQ